MIYAQISDWKNYSALGEAFVRAMAELTRPDLSDRPAGKKVLIPGKLWLSIEEPRTRAAEEVPFEAHRKFVDIQTTLKGTERIGFAPLSRLVPQGPYDEDEDIRYFSGEGTALNCTGMFALFFPEDGHQPCCSAASGEAGRIKKAVVKIHRSLLNFGEAAE